MSFMSYKYALLSLLGMNFSIIIIFIFRRNIQIFITGTYMVVIVKTMDGGALRGWVFVLLVELKGGSSNLTVEVHELVF